MKAIVNADKNWGIGNSNDLLFHIPEDMKYFKEKTMGNVVVMGLATLKSFPGGNPLKDRVNIVLSNDESFYRDDVIICSSLENLFETLKRYKEDEIYVIGGASVYAQLIPYCDTVYVTKVDSEKEADKFFPNLDEDDNWMMVREGEEKEYNGVKFRFTKYKNIED